MYHTWPQYMQVFCDDWRHIPDKVLGEGSEHRESKGMKFSLLQAKAVILIAQDSSVMIVEFPPQISSMERQPLPTWLFLFPEGTRLSSAKLKVTIGRRKAFPNLRKFVRKF